MWEYNGGWETENESFDTSVESWVSELESWNLKPSDADGGDREQRGSEWVCEWDFEIVLGSEYGSVRERGGREHKVEGERKAKMKKQKGREFRVFYLKLGWNGAFCTFFFFFFFFFEFRPKSAASEVSPDTARGGVNQSDLVWISANRPESESRRHELWKKKKKKLDGGLTRQQHPSHVATLDAGAAPLEPRSCFPHRSSLSCHKFSSFFLARRNIYPIQGIFFPSLQACHLIKSWCKKRSSLS